MVVKLVVVVKKVGVAVVVEEDWRGDTNGGVW